MKRRSFIYVAVLLIGFVLGGIVQPFKSLPTLAQGSCQTFPETGKTVCGRFLQYWKENGGLAQQGYPISNPFQEKSDLDGKVYTVQYFERAVFEAHPENNPPYDVLLSQLGTFRFKAKYPSGDPSGSGQPTQAPPQPTQAPSQPTQAPSSSGPAFKVVDTNSYKPQYSSYVHIVGVGQNTGNVQLGSLKLVASFKDASGKVVSTESTYGPSGLMPGERWPFSILVEDSVKFSTVDFQVETGPMSNYDKQSVYRDFQVLEANKQPAPSYSTGISVVGTIKNTGSSTATLISVYIGAYDSSGKIVDADQTFTELTTLEPGATSPFKAELSNAKDDSKVTVIVESFKK